MIFTELPPTIRQRKKVPVEKKCRPPTFVVRGGRGGYPIKSHFGSRITFCEAILRLVLENILAYSPNIVAGAVKENNKQ